MKNDTLKMAEANEFTVQQDALGKVNRVKEIRRRGKDSLKINRQQEDSVTSHKCEAKGMVCEVCNYLLVTEGKE